MNKRLLKDVPAEFRVKVGGSGDFGLNQKPFAIAIYEVRDGQEYGHTVQFSYKQEMVDCVKRLLKLIESVDYSSGFLASRGKQNEP